MYQFVRFGHWHHVDFFSRQKYLASHARVGCREGLLTRGHEWRRPRYSRIVEAVIDVDPQSCWKRRPRIIRSTRPNAPFDFGQKREVRAIAAGSSWRTASPCSEVHRACWQCEECCSGARARPAAPCPLPVTDNAIDYSRTAPRPLTMALRIRPKSAPRTSKISGGRSPTPAKTIPKAQRLLSVNSE